MISFKEFLTEAAIKPWNLKPHNGDSDLPTLFKTIISKCPRFPEMLANGGILFRGWSKAENRIGLYYDVSIIDTSKSIRTSRDTNNFYQTCMDYSQAMSNVPSRTKSLIVATHIDAAEQFGRLSAIIPFANTIIAVSGEEDLFWVKLDRSAGKDTGVEELCNWAGDNLKFNNAEKFSLADIPEIKSEMDSWDSEKIKQMKIDTYNTDVLSLFTQFKINRFDNFCKKYINPRNLGIKLFTVGDKLPIKTGKSRQEKTNSQLTRFDGNEAWFSGKAFVITSKIWHELLDYCESELELKVHKNCREQPYDQF